METKSILDKRSNDAKVKGVIDYTLNKMVSKRYHFQLDAESDIKTGFIMLLLETNNSELLDDLNNSGCKYNNEFYPADYDTSEIVTEILSYVTELSKGLSKDNIKTNKDSLSIVLKALDEFQAEFSRKDAELYKSLYFLNRYNDIHFAIGEHNLYKRKAQLANSDGTSTQLPGVQVSSVQVSSVKLSKAKLKEEEILSNWSKEHNGLKEYFCCNDDWLYSEIVPKLKKVTSQGEIDNVEVFQTFISLTKRYSMMRNPKAYLRYEGGDKAFLWCALKYEGLINVSWEYFKSIPKVSKTK